VHSDKKLFEFLLLESAQAGLSWSIILKKREGYRKAFDDFDANKVANYDQRRVQELLTNPSIIRNRLKIQSTITNARAFLKLQQEFGSFDSYLWNLAGSKEVIFLDSQAACITATSGVYKVGSIDGKYHKGTLHESSTTKHEKNDFVSIYIIELMPLHPELIEPINSLLEFITIV
jgi:DNA-3-methyladenine glycosylase I